MNAPDMQRVRMSLPHFEEFGWRPYVLAAEATGSEVLEPLLLRTLPADVRVERVKPLSASMMRTVGIGNLALRALPALYAAGARLITDEHIDLVYFSTTMFLAMPLGRVWKRRFGTPFVLDFQDPWLSDYYETHPDTPPPAKYFAARRLNAMLEPWTLARVDGIVSVSPDYVSSLRRRYPRLRDVPCATLPFGASDTDFDLLEQFPQANRHFDKGNGHVNGVYVGRGGEDLAVALEILFRALSRGLESAPDAFKRVALHFIGTDYATDQRARKTVEPVADRAGVRSQVSEDTRRAPYFEALQLLRDADFLVVVGSDDPAYTPSKIYPYILARKPLVAIVHERSTLVDVLRETHAGLVVTFSSRPGEDDKRAAVESLVAGLAGILGNPSRPDTDWSAFEQYTAREMTRRQCELLDAALEHSNREVS